MALRPWSPIPIVEAGESMVELPQQLWRLEPHPYVRLGAPYGPHGDPFRLRSGVVRRLLQAEEGLRLAESQCRLAIYDAWRPLAVQSFMVRHAVEEECARSGVDPHQPSVARDRVVAEVGRFWAPASDDPATPPPHSTGAAVDLTLADDSGITLSMGGEIDAIGPVSEPEFHAEAALADPDGDKALWHGRRQLLARVMADAGFVQHPNEWWHFSWGDQLWAWRRGEGRAHYGRIDEAASSLAN